jgi:hypothetical protein
LLPVLPHPYRNDASLKGENKNKEETLITIDNEPAPDGKLSTEILR